MITVVYNHPLHGEQILKCAEIVKSNGMGGLAVKNIHGATFQLIDGNRIKSIKQSEEEIK